MTGPAYVRTVDLEHLPSQSGLGPLYVPTCPAHARVWSGPSTRNLSTASTNAAVHNSDVHRHDQAGLFDLRTSVSRDDVGR